MTEKQSFCYAVMNNGHVICVFLDKVRAEEFVCRRIDAATKVKYSYPIAVVECVLND